MHVTIRRYKIPSESSAEINRRVQEVFLPMISKLPGFVEYFWISAGENEMFSISVFTNRAGAEASVQTATEFVRKNLASFLPKPPEVISGEVVLHQAKSKAEQAA